MYHHHLALEAFTELLLAPLVLSPVVSVVREPASGNIRGVRGATQRYLTRALLEKVAGLERRIEVLAQHYRSGILGRCRTQKVLTSSGAGWRMASDIAFRDSPASWTRPKKTFSLTLPSRWSIGRGSLVQQAAGAAKRGDKEEDGGGRNLPERSGGDPPYGCGALLAA